ncbi:MAG: hypothetical protein JXA68_08245 [Ignavibacteriales bacterium]|nr:hypothetical protein [Ignavibacteriales bacterium]
MKILHIIFIVLVCSNLYSQEFNQEYGYPQIVLIEYDPWAMAIGSDTPTFALYDSGIVIYKDIENDINLSVKLTIQQKDSLINYFAISDSLFTLPEQIIASYWTDQPDNTLYIIFDSVKAINVYGSIRNVTEARAKTPKSFLDLFDKLISFKNDNAKIWLPDKIEAMVWDYSHSLGESLKWPEGWPDLNSPDTIDWGEMYSIYIDRKYYDDLIQFLKKRGEKQSIEINDKKFTVVLRFPFPNM